MAGEMVVGGEGERKGVEVRRREIDWNACYKTNIYAGHYMAFSHGSCIFSYESDRQLSCPSTVASLIIPESHWLCLSVG
jgi:hypothetical protein